jgi:hypothetical protein
MDGTKLTRRGSLGLRKAGTAYVGSITMGVAR